MKIAYLIQYFGSPENSFASGRSYDFAIEWAKAGHEVWIICSDAYLLDKSKPIFFDDLPINVSIIRQEYSNSFGILARVQAFLLFACKALLLFLNNPQKYDVLYASSTPLSIGIVGLVQKIITKKKWVFEIRDLWPDFPLQVLGLQGSFVGKVLLRIERWLYKSADFIICLSPISKNELITQKKIAKTKVAMVPNGFSVVDEVANKPLPYTYGFYEGALGKANGIPWLMEFVDELLRKNNAIHFVIAGFGKMENVIQKWIFNHINGNRIHYLGTISRKKTAIYLSYAKFSVTCFSDYPILKSNSPNKLFDAIGLGIPVVSNTEGWIETLAIEYGGVCHKNAKRAAGLVLEGNFSTQISNKKYLRSNLAKEVLSIIQNCE